MMSVTMVSAIIMSVIRKSVILMSVNIANVVAPTTNVIIDTLDIRLNGEECNQQ